MRKQRLPERLHQGKTMTRDDLAGAIGVSANAIRQHLHNLQKVNLLRREVGGKQSYWMVIQPPC